MKMMLESKVLLSSNFFCLNMICFFKKIQTGTKSHSLVPDAANLDVLMSHNFMKTRSHDSLAAKGLLWFKSSLHMSQVAHQARVYPCFCSME